MHLKSPSGNVAEDLAMAIACEQRQVPERAAQFLTNPAEAAVCGAPRQCRAGLGLACFRWSLTACSIQAAVSNHARSCP